LASDDAISSDAGDTTEEGLAMGREEGRMQVRCGILYTTRCGVVLPSAYPFSLCSVLLGLAR
jgi:hypothetical protein